MSESNSRSRRAERAFATGLLAVATSLAAFSAQAAGVVKFSGSSSFAVNQARALALLCGNAGGQANIYKNNDSSTHDLGNVFTVACAVEFQNGGGADEARFNVAGGSFSAVLNRTGNTGALPVPLISATLCSLPFAAVNLGAGSGPLAWINGNQTRLSYCPTAAALAPDTTDGGVLDVDGEVFSANGVTTPWQVVPDRDYVRTAMFQVFGLAVSRDLYLATQAHQAAQGRLPAQCTTVTNANGVATYVARGGTVPECQPSVPQPLVLAMMTSGGLNNARRAGANSFIGGTQTVKNDLPADKAISPDMPLNSRFVLCRRPVTAGAQAASGLYYLNSPTGTGDLRGALGSVGPSVAGFSTNIGPSFRVTTNSGSSEQRNCLNSVSAGANYAAGVLSLAYNPLGGADRYRFPRVNGRLVVDGTVDSWHTGELMRGNYDFAYELINYCPNGSCPALLDAVFTALVAAMPAGGSGTTPGIVRSVDTEYFRSRVTEPVRGVR
jgi:hypothetical protein